MSADQTLDPGALERLLEITGGDLEFVDELVDTFIDDAGTQLDALDAAVAAGDIDALVRPAHSLKSNADNVGAVTLRDLSRGLEADGKAGDVPDAAARVAAIRAEFDAVHGALLDARTNR
jgi:HPt (histidine-containing phosphotransfer) domain-containing protein